MGTIHTATLMQMMHIFWANINCFSMYATRVTRSQRVILRRIGAHGHFRSRDKDSGHIIRSTVAKNPLLYANSMALS